MGKKVILTGSRGIAAALVAQLSKKDYSIFIVGGEEKDCKSLSEEFTQVVGFSAVDIRDEQLVVSAFAQALKKLDGLDHVVSIVGGSGRSFGDGAIEDISKSAWDQTLDLNLTTAFLTAREAIKHFKSQGGGSLILTSSILATAPSPEFFRTHAYAVAKGGINTLVKTLSAAYLTDSIRVNAVAPSLVATPMAARAAQNPEIAEFTKKKQPFAPSQLSADQVAAAYVYLMENQGVTGQIIEIDGGWSVNSGV
jgi:NAD(P)-dependent dehydrogenase (short-subunit alcohol dehydrogenase family)